MVYFQQMGLNMATINGNMLEKGFESGTFTTKYGSNKVNNKYVSSYSVILT